MEAYTDFAQVYDMFMDNVPYEEWCGYLIRQLQKHGISDGILLDLGCGTGKMTRRMAQAGYDMIGVDNSMEMLEIARETDSDSSILYLLQDMREFELYGTVRAVYSACDSLNYILEREDLLKVFRLVNNYLDPGGIFIFDMNTSYKYEQILADNTFAENRETSSFIWENFYDETECINEYALTLFIEEEDGRFSRYQEEHYQKAYTLEMIKALLQEAGLELVSVYNAYTENALAAESDRMTIIAKECTKTVK